MKKFVASILALALLTATAFGAASVDVTESVKVKKGRMARITVTTTGVDVKVVNLFEEDLDVFREYDPDPKKFVFRITADKVGTYKLGFVTSDKDGTSDPKYSTIEVFDPAPVPVPDPKPDPKPVPKTVKAYVIVVEDTSKVNESRGQLFTNKELADFIKSKSWTWKVVDVKAVDKNGKTPADVLPYIERAKSKAVPQLYVVNQDGDVISEGDLPADSGEILTKLKGL